MIRQGAKHLLESTVVPLGLFYLLLVTVGFSGGLIAALSWSMLALIRRIVLRRPIPAVLVLTTGLLIGRTVLGLVTGSAFLYFLQPTLQNFLVAIVLVGSLPYRRPFIAKLADDFCAFPAAFRDHPRVLRMFRRLSLFWALVFLTNGVTTLWMLAKETVGDFLMVSTAGSWSVGGLAIIGSLLWTAATIRPWRMTDPTTVEGRAPSAIRMPISRVVRATE